MVLVISRLVSLMVEQVGSLRKCGVSAASLSGNQGSDKCLLASEKYFEEDPTPVESLGRLLPCTWNLLKLSLASSRNLCSLLSMDSAFAWQFQQMNGGRPLPSANGTNRSRLRCPGRSSFNSTGLNKAVECFRATSRRANTACTKPQGHFAENHTEAWCQQNSG